LAPEEPDVLKVMSLPEMAMVILLELVALIHSACALVPSADTDLTSRVR
jgi:hypothetical protein